MAEKIDRYQNWEATIKDGVLTIRINVRENEVDVRPSASGKTMVVATTGGAARVDGSPLKLNMTVYRPQ
jgi:hypothetical protein